MRPVRSYRSHVLWARSDGSHCSMPRCPAPAGTSKTSCPQGTDRSMDALLGTSRGICSAPPAENWGGPVRSWIHHVTEPKPNFRWRLVFHWAGNLAGSCTPDTLARHLDEPEQMVGLRRGASSKLRHDLKTASIGNDAVPISQRSESPYAVASASRPPLRCLVHHGPLSLARRRSRISTVTPFIQSHNRQATGVPNVAVPLMRLEECTHAIGPLMA